MITSKVALRARTLLVLGGLGGLGCGAGHAPATEPDASPPAAASDASSAVGSLGSPNIEGSREPETSTASVAESETSASSVAAPFPSTPSVAAPSPSASSVAAPSTGRAGIAHRDFALRLGIGWSATEVQLLRGALDAWSHALGLPIELRGGYGPTGLAHIFEELPPCGQESVFDGLLGCYNPKTDVLALSRPAVRFFATHEALADGSFAARPLSAAQQEQAFQELLYAVLLHELGHWLGLAHVEPEQDSIMQASLPLLMKRQTPSQLSADDIKQAARLNLVSLSEQAASTP